MIYKENIQNFYKQELTFKNVEKIKSDFDLL